MALFLPSILTALTISASPASLEPPSTYTAYSPNIYSNEDTEHRGTGRREILAQALIRGYITSMGMVCGRSASEIDFIRIPQDINGWETLTIQVQLPTDEASQAAALAIASGQSILAGGVTTVPEVLRRTIERRGCIPVPGSYSYIPF